MGGKERAKPALAGYDSRQIAQLDTFLRMKGFLKQEPGNNGRRSEGEERPSISPAMRGIKYSQSWGGERPITVLVDTMGGNPGLGPDLVEVLFRFELQNVGKGALIAPNAFPKKALMVERRAGEMAPDSRYDGKPSDQIFMKRSEQIVVSGTVAAYPSNAMALAAIKPDLAEQAKADSSMRIDITTKNAWGGGSGRNILLIDPNIIDPVRYTETMLYIISKITSRIISLGSDKDALRGADAIDMQHALSKVPVDSRNSFHGWLSDMRNELSMKLDAIAMAVGSDPENSAAMGLLADKSI